MVWSYLDARLKTGENGQGQGLGHSMGKENTMKGLHVLLLVALAVVSGALPNHIFAGSVTYTYDDLNRLIKVQYDDGTTISYMYNEVGNRLVKSVFIQSPPVADDQNGSTPPDTPLPLTLSYTDPDGPGPYTFTIVSGPSNGQLTGADANRTYTPDPGYTGADAFMWKVRDGIADSNNATFSLTVNP